MTAFNSDTFNRLSLGIMEKEQCGPELALEKLQGLSLHLAGGVEVSKSIPLQAALVTAVNTGTRAFLGGVSISLPGDCPCLLPWFGNPSLAAVIISLGGMVSTEIGPHHTKISFGLSGDTVNCGLRVVCNDWQGGVITDRGDPELDLCGTSPLAGIFAGALAVGLSFLQASGIQPDAADQSVGISLWRPDLDWRHPDAAGPGITLLPANYWLLGLGHLGQAYLWAIALLPYQYPEQVGLLLQDDDRIEAANWSAGLLTAIADAGTYKTRVCNRWLEARRFQPKVTERRFNGHTVRSGEEPFLALCGFDSTAGRRVLEGAGFDLVVEAGLGGNLATFDRISLHTFPDGYESAASIWMEPADPVGEFNVNIYDLIKDRTEEVCGILPLTIAGKAMSASFVGACTGALVLAETLRGLHGGLRYDKLSLQLRDMSSLIAIPHTKGDYTTELSRNGLLDAKSGPA